jgi:hypothetical protein
MRLSGPSLAAVFLLASFLAAQHSSSSAGSSGSSSSSSSGGGSRSSSSGGSSYSGSSSGSSHSVGGGFSSNSNHGSGGAHASGGTSISHGSAARGRNEHGSSLVNSHKGTENSTSRVVHPIHEPKPGVPQRAVVPEKRGFFSFLRHPFRRPQPKVVARPALYLPRPICPKGRCAPVCTVGQASRGGICVTPPIAMCVPGQIWNNVSCGARYQCSPGEIWSGSSCLYHTQFLNQCFALGTALYRQERRVEAAESIRQSACANGAAQECSEATAAWQSEENLRQNLLTRYRQCQMQSIAASSGGYGLSLYDSTTWFDFLRFDVLY